MKKFIAFLILFLCGSSFFLKASLTNTERIIKLTPSHLEKRGLTYSNVEVATDQLFTALFFNDLSGVRKALEEGADPNAQLNYHYFTSNNNLLILWVTPTMLTAKLRSHHSVNILKALVAAKADITVYATDARKGCITDINALTIAIEHGNFAVKEHLLKKISGPISKL